MKTRIHSFVYILMLSGAAMQARADLPELLVANFNDLPLDQQIDSGGAELGEPVVIDSGLSAIVRAAPRPTPSLELSQALSGRANSARFEFLGNEEIMHGDLTIRLEFRARQFDAFQVSIREVGSDVQDFASLVIASFGSLVVSDKNGFAGNIGPYAIDTDHQLAFKFHMDAGTYDIELDSLPVLTARAHGVTGRGVGALLLGTGSSTLLGSLLYVDHIRVVRGDGVFRNGFN
jgi:hypothetical protein